MIVHRFSEAEAPEATPVHDREQDISSGPPCEIHAAFWAYSRDSSMRFAGYSPWAFKAWKAQRVFFSIRAFGTKRRRPTLLGLQQNGCSSVLQTRKHKTQSGDRSRILRSCNGRRGRGLSAAPKHRKEQHKPNASFCESRISRLKI